MAAGPQSPNGNFPSIAAMPVVFGTITTLGPGGQDTKELLAGNLPGFRAWFSPSIAGCTVVLQFAQGNQAGAVNWEPLGVTIALAAGPQLLGPFSLGSRRYRASLTLPAPGSVKYRLVAALT
jgi:hypothetical protein